MAQKFLKTAGGNFNAANTWSATSAAGVDNAGPPTAADDCIAELLSGPLTINSGSVCRSFDTTSGVGTYGGTITHSSSVTWAIGDGTAGAGNVALKLNSGVTYNKGSNTSSAINFVSTSTTQQSITFAGKTHGNINFNGTGGSWLNADAMIGASATTTGVTLTAGSWATGSNALTFGTLSLGTSTTRAFTAGTSLITLASTGTAFVLVTTGLTLSVASSTIRLTGAGATFSGGNSSAFGTIEMLGSGIMVTLNLGGAVNLNRTGTANKTDGITFNRTLTLTGTFTLAGNSASNRLLVASSGIGTSRSMTLSGVSKVFSNIDLRDIAIASGSGNIAATTGGAGDLGGNSGWTFTTAQNNYWVAGTGDTSDAANHIANSSGGTPGTGRVNLAQDTLIFDSNSFSAGSQIVTNDMPRMGNINFTGATNTPTYVTSTANQEYYGSVTLISGMNLTAGTVVNFFGRSAFSLTSGGKNFTNGVTINAFGGSITLQDAFLSSGNLVVTRGTFNANNFNVTVFKLDAATTTTRAVTAGSGTWTLTGSADTLWDMSTITGLTYTPNTATILVTDTSANQNFLSFPNGSSPYIIQNTAGGANTPMLVIGTNTGSGSLTINSIILAPKTQVDFQSGTTYTVTNFIATGSSGNVITIRSNSGVGTTWTLSSPNTISLDWVNLQGSIGAGAGIPFYAGNNSTNGGNNTNWIFTAPPHVGGGAGRQMTVELTISIP